MGVERAFPNLSFQRLTNMVQPDDGLDRIFVTEQDGRVHSFPNRQDTPGATLFLDITDRVNPGGNEEGLLGLAFDPGFKANGYFYVYYSAAGPRRSVLSRFAAVGDNPDDADPESEFIIMEIPQPFANHNGGQLAFGPDGYLYLGLGDGGSGGDPRGNGQNTGTLLGSILRIDIGGASEHGNYRVPPENPLVGVPGARTEIWAYGLRNPWRFSFDTDTGTIWTGDVGQNNWEEVNLVERGANYGWNVLEGRHCFSPAASCDPTGTRLPIVEYPTGDGCSIIGGYVYRGARLPSLLGAYIFGDYCSGQIWGLQYAGRAAADPVLLSNSGLRITSFGRDLAGNLYVLSQNEGIYRLVPAG